MSGVSHANSAASCAWGDVEVTCDRTTFAECSPTWWRWQSPEGSTHKIDRASMKLSHGSISWPMARHATCKFARWSVRLRMIPLPTANSQQRARTALYGHRPQSASVRSHRRLVSRDGFKNVSVAFRSHADFLLERQAPTINQAITKRRLAASFYARPDCRQTSRALARGRTSFSRATGQPQSETNWHCAGQPLGHRRLAA